MMDAAALKKELSINGSSNRCFSFQRSRAQKKRPGTVGKLGHLVVVPTKDVCTQKDALLTAAIPSSPARGGFVPRSAFDSEREKPAQGGSPCDVVVLTADKTLAEYLQTALRRAGYATFWATMTSHVFSISRQSAPFLILVDCRIREWPVIRTEPTLGHVPLVAVVPFGCFYTESHCLADLERGMDGVHNLRDGHRLLVAKVGAYLRQGVRSRAPRGVYRIGAIELDLDACEVTIAGQQVHLSPKPLAILTALMQKPGKILTRRELSDILWGPNFAVSRHTLDVHIHALRRQLARDPDRLCQLVTIKGVGFKLKPISPTDRTPREEFVRGQNQDSTRLHNRVGLQYLLWRRRQNRTTHPERRVEAAARGASPIRQHAKASVTGR